MKELNSLYIIGESRTNADNAITKMFSSFYMASEVHKETGEILDFSWSNRAVFTKAVCGAGLCGV